MPITQTNEDVPHDISKMQAVKLARTLAYVLLGLLPFQQYFCHIEQLEGW